MAKQYHAKKKCKRLSIERRRKLALEEIADHLCAINCTLQSIATSMATPMPDDGEYTRLRAHLAKLTTLGTPSDATSSKEPEHGN